MINVSTYTNVATSLLRVYQRYTKGIRFLLIMFLTLTVTTNAWGAEYELVSFSDIKTNDVIIIVGTKSGTAYAMKNTGTPPTPIKVTISNSKITSTATDITFTATNNGDNTITFVSTTSGTLYCTNDNNGVKIGSKTGNDTKFSFDSSVNRLKNIGKTRWLGIYNTQDWRCYTSASATNISGTTTTFYRKVTAAASYTITATSNNNSYGTVSVSGTTITATPNDGYRVKSGDAGYTVTSGTAVVTNNGDNTFSVTPSSNCTITINFEAIPTYTINWHTAVGTVVDAVLEEGATITKPATDPTMSGYVFMGWTEDCEVASDGAGFTAITNFGTATKDKDYYAVFAVATTTSGGGSSNYEKVTSNLTDWAGDYLIAYNNTTFADGRTGGTSGMGAQNKKVDLSSKISNNTIPASVGDQYNVTLEAVTGGYVLKTKDGKYNYQSTNANGLATTTSISTASQYAIKVTFTSENDINLALTGNAAGAVFRYNTQGYFRFYKSGGQSAVYLYKKVEGGSTTTYDNYITTCATDELCTDAVHVNKGTPSNGSFTMVSGHQSTCNGPLTVTLSNIEPATGYQFSAITQSGVDAAKVTIDNTAKTVTYAKNTTGTSTINVTFTQAIYTITYKDQGDATFSGTHEDDYPKYHTYNTATTLKSASKDHYTFDGWYKESDCSGTEVTTLGATEYTNDITLYAKWTAKTYTITLDANGGTFVDKRDSQTKGSATFDYIYGTYATYNDAPNLTDYYTDLKRTGYQFDKWVSAGSPWNKLFTSTGDRTIQAQWSKLYTITLSENGTTTEPTTQTSTTYKLPTELTAGSCQDDTKELVGWSTVAIPTPGDKPASNFYELGETVTLTADQTTFYAVFATAEGVSSTDYEQITNINNLTDGKYVIAYGYNTTTPSIILEAATKDATTLVATSASPSSDKYQNPAAENIWFIKKNGTTYTLYNDATSKYVQANTTPALLLADANPTNFNIEYSTDHWKIKINGNTSYQLVGYTNVSGNYFQTKSGASASYKIQLYKNTSTVSYSEYTTTCIPTYSITYDFAGGTGSHCSNTSVPQGHTYTICDEAPTKTGNTFLHWSDGTSTYAAGATITPTSDVTLTAVWKANTYTVTWNNNGDTDEVTYNHGDALVVPTAPASCDGVKEFVGWTTHSGYYHATTAPDDIFTTKTTPVTATATYYAVFATPGAGGTEFVLGESGTFKMYANVDGTNHYAQGGVSSSKLSSTTDILTASDYTLTYADGSYTIKQGTSTIGHSSSTNLTSTTVSTWTISEGANGSWRITSDKDNSRALSYSAEANAFKAYATSNITAGDDTYFDIEFGSGSNAYSDYTTICQTVEKIEIANYTTEFFVTDEFAFGGTVTAHFDGGGTQDVTALAHFSGYNMNVTGTYTITVTYMGATATYEITVKPLDNAWVLTWNVSGKTNTGLGPRSVTKGSAIGTLPTPVIPDACAGKTFMGWTESNVVNSDGSGITYINEGTVPTANTTYYAVFATVNNFCTQKPINEITSGSKVVIVAVASLDNTGSTGKAISSRTISITSRGVIGLAGDDVAIFDETINTPHNTCIWTLTKQGETVAFKQDSKYIRATDSGYRRLVLDATADYWTLIPVAGKDKTYHMKSGNTSHYVEWFDHTDSKYDEGERYIGFIPYTEANDNGDFDMQFFVVAGDGADITDYTTGCAEYTITYYGFRGGYSTSSSSDGTIVLPVNSLHTVPDCGDVVKDHTNLGREFLNVWMTKPHGGHTFKPGDTFILTQDTTLYAQWKLETNSDLTTLPTDIEDLAGTDVYVYGGKTLNIQPGTTTINSLTLKGGIQIDGSYQMPSVWVPEGATLVRNSNKIYLDLVVNAKTWYPFAVPFETKNTSDIHYLHPDMRDAATYGKHFDIKTYDGARRADVGEDKANNWVRLKRHTTDEPVSFKPGVGYIISAMAYPGKDTATIRIPMTVPNTWFKNGEQVVVGTTVRNTIAVTAHGGPAATEHLRHAGWNFVANPYLSYFTGGGIDSTNGLDYIDGELIINSGFSYGGEAVPYVTIPAYDFSCYTAHKLSDIKLSPEYSFFVQVGTSGTMNFTTEGRQKAPAALRSNIDNPRIETDIVISHNQQTADHTGLIIDDRYTTAYEIGADLEKMFGSAYNTTIYTLGNDVRLAYNALSHIEATIPIPLGFRAETDGEYTISLTNPEDILTVESIVLQDSYNNTTTNLLLNDYTFYTDRTQDDQRFVVYIVPHNNAPTDISTIIDNDTETRKVIHNHRLYIIHNGHVYDGVGQTIQ